MHVAAINESSKNEWVLQQTNEYSQHQRRQLLFHNSPLDHHQTLCCSCSPKDSTKEHWGTSVTSQMTRKPCLYQYNFIFVTLFIYSSMKYWNSTSPNKHLIIVRADFNRISKRLCRWTKSHLWCSADLKRSKNDVHHSLRCENIATNDSSRITRIKKRSFWYYDLHRFQTTLKQELRIIYEKLDNMAQLNCISISSTLPVIQLQN